jgi:hypothetical protein
MPSETTSSASTRRRRLSDRRFAFPAIILLAAILTLYGLGAAQVCGFNEAVEGVALQQMVEHGKLLFPLQNGRFPMYKPPLFHSTAPPVSAESRSSTCAYPPRSMLSPVSRSPSPSPRASSAPTAPLSPA